MREEQENGYLPESLQRVGCSWGTQQALILQKGNLRAGVGPMKTDGQTWSPRSQ